MQHLGIAFTVSCALRVTHGDQKTARAHLSLGVREVIRQPGIGAPATRIAAHIARGHVVQHRLLQLFVLAQIGRNRIDLMVTGLRGLE